MNEVIVKVGMLILWICQITDILVSNRTWFFGVSFRAYGPRNSRGRISTRLHFEVSAGNSLTLKWSATDQILEQRL